MKTALLWSLIFGSLLISKASSELLFEMTSNESTERYQLAKDKVVVNKRFVPPSISADQIIGEFAILPTSKALGLYSQNSARSLSAIKYFPIRDEVSGRYGVSDGSLFIFPKEMSTAEAVTAEYGLEIIKIFANARMVQIRVSDTDDPFAMVSALRRDSRLNHAELNTSFGDSVAQ